MFQEITLAQLAFRRWFGRNSRNASLWKPWPPVFLPWKDQQSRLLLWTYDEREVWGQILYHSQALHAEAQLDDEWGEEEAGRRKWGEGERRKEKTYKKLKSEKLDK